MNEKIETSNIENKIKEEIAELNKKLYAIKKKGWHKTLRKGSGGIGKTLETLLGKKEDSNPLPDYKHFEIKAKKYGSISYITLFSITPQNDLNEIEINRLVKNYGYPDKVLNNCKILRGEIYSNKKNLIGNNYYFQLNIKEERIYISIFYKNGILKEEIAYWKISDIQKRLYQKLSYLVLVNAIKYTRNNIDYYKYYNYDFYKLKKDYKFIELLKQGTIRIKLKIGVYREGTKKGQIYDHGTSFEIKEENIDKMFTKYVRNNKGTPYK